MTLLTPSSTSLALSCGGTADNSVIVCSSALFSTSGVFVGSKSHQHLSGIKKMAQKNDENDNNGEECKLTDAEVAIIEFMKQKAMLEASGGNGKEEPNKEHKFWDTQVSNKVDFYVCVVSLGSTLLPCFSQYEHTQSSFIQPMPHATSSDNIPEGAIVPNKPKEELHATPYTMSAGFEWSNVDVSQQEQCDEVYKLLAANYVKDDDCLFHFEYSRNFLEWALMPPGSKQEFLLSVQSSSKGKLVAFISAIPAKVQVRDHLVKMVEKREIACQWQPLISLTGLWYGNLCWVLLLYFTCGHQNM